MKTSEAQDDRISRGSDKEKHQMKISEAAKKAELKKTGESKMTVSTEFGKDFDTMDPFAYGKLLELAHKFEWKPQGTISPERWNPGWAGKDWDPYQYVTNDGQTVTDEDALAIAEALERALKEIPDEESEPMELFVYEPSTNFLEEMDALEKARKGMEYHLIDPKVLFAGKNGKAKIMRFIDLCRQGGFVIF